MLLGHTALSLTSLAVPNHPDLLARLTPAATGLITATLVATTGDLKHPWQSAYWGVPLNVSVSASMFTAATHLLLATVVIAVRYTWRRDTRGIWALLILLTRIAQLAVHTAYHSAPLYDLLDNLQVTEHYLAFSATVTTCAVLTTTVLPTAAFLNRRRITHTGQQALTEETAA